MYTIEEFTKLGRPAMLKAIKDDFLAAAKGLSRANKGKLAEVYARELLKRIEKEPLGIPDTMDDAECPAVSDCPEPEKHSTNGCVTGRFRSDVPNISNPPKADLGPPVREHGGLYFRLHKGDPRRKLTQKELQVLEDLAKLLPKVGPRRLGRDDRGKLIREDPARKERRALRGLVKHLNWSRIEIVPPPPPPEPPLVLQENL